MKRRLFGVPIAAAICAVVFLGLASSASAYSNDFESNTAGWFDNVGTITQQSTGYVNPGGYASGVASAGGTHHAVLDRGTCGTQTGGSGTAVHCPGPYTYWGDGNNYTWNGPYTTQVDVYLDTTYANTYADTYAGNIGCLTAAGGSTDTTCKGTRFDYTSAINSSTPDVNGDAQHLRDFGFNVSTGYAGDNCDGFMVTGQTVVNRINANPNIGQHDPQCISQTGWYTFKHSFSEENGYLKVVMEIISVATGNTVASWTITGIDRIEDVGCNRYGWFSNQEIYGLPIDNAKMEGGCATPAVTEGQISPTRTTCEQYRDGAAPVLEEVRYTTRGNSINAVSPGVFFYYGKVSGTEDQTVDITQTHTGTAPPIPILNGQVVLYDASTCKVLKWDVTVNADGTATGTLPSSGDFIVGVKYSPSSLKGQPPPSPATVTYSFGTTDPATIDLAPKG